MHNRATASVRSLLFCDLAHAGRAGSNRAVLTSAGWSAPGTEETIGPAAGGSAYRGAADRVCVVPDRYP
jgi:hypothetical protein